MSAQARPRSGIAESMRLSPAELETVRALVDTLAPGTSSTDGGLPSASAVGVDADLAHLVNTYMNEGLRRSFLQFLRTIESPGLNLLLSGRPARFHRLSPKDREAFLLAWSRSRLAAKRMAFQAIKRLALFLYYAKAGIDPDGPIARGIGYQLPREDVAAWVAAPEPVLGPSTVPDSGTANADVCVVGSGAGGSIIAAHLAQCGHRVVILESGPFRTAASFSRDEGSATESQWDGHGLLATGDLAFQILAGRMAGGSTPINWMTCLPPSALVRAEWQDLYGYSGASHSSFDDDLHLIQQRLGVNSDESPLYPSNGVLARGCRALGYAEGRDFEIIPRNARGCDGRCSACSFGCPFEAKQSALTTYLADALRSKASLYCDTRADRILMDRGRAVGVEATCSAGPIARTFTIHSRVVVMAGGAIRSPALLLRSGLNSPGIGRHLHLHPTSAVFAAYDRPIEPWRGPMQTVVVRRHQDPDGGLHGPWIESAPAHPGLAALGVPWLGGEPHRREMVQIARAAATIALVRDVGEGSVTLDPRGEPRIHYSLDDADRRHLAQGLVEAARIHLAAGARRVVTLHQAGCEVHSPDGLDAFQDRVDALGFEPNRLVLFSAHPSGTLRLGEADPTSVGRSSGETFEVENLYVGDGSALPSAPGVNPMLSIMAVARQTAASIHERLRAG